MALILAQNLEKKIESIEHVPASERGKGFPPFEKQTFASQLLWLAIFFIALYAIIARLAIPRIGGIIAARAQRVGDDLGEANRLKDQSDAALNAYEASIADARGRAQTLANETRDRLNAEAEEHRRRLETDLNARLVKAEEVIAATKTAAMTNVHGIAADTASAIVERLIGNAPSGAAIEAAVTEALKR
jgi:F-type H+-transporting ATPase subunit b